ncbi:hypothetical protein PHYSODRAFT_509099 [Phytophthora sojae]|uniref:Uncharacterized protein n=1 Tax=Phytophthora sojae (strain P6497) TaxID=1094619 RepID=G4ZPN1_PHYSP|nr:hypothetical protein PHYSODRAFT_509099 [Phytophthora sojae]EGZ15821.1 hypothetical protein PHYSODRAFT_509099 [Phytophthora sojae]|eukprot:XP_009529570.1 hypothetical protein PHYSODRAFT_509099 [Phytophthora sojae]
MARIDPLFEFDAPQSYRDLSAPLSPLPAGEHDPWFDRVHPEHSRPGAELARELEAKLQKQEQQQLKEDKENQRPVAADWRSIVTARNKQLKSEKKEFRSLKEMRATHKPFQGKKEQMQEQEQEQEQQVQSRRKPLVDVGNRLNTHRKRERAATAASKEKKEMKNLQELLARHNKKFKATHTYEPPQHSVRVVKQWERETKQSYYALSAEERVQANREIAAWKKRREAEACH